ncbi:hypothetical protein ACIOKD_41605, partial [Streptomyces sp. NPDC087844]
SLPYRANPPPSTAEQQQVTTKIIKHTPATPQHGAKLIYEEAAAELNSPDALQPIVDLARALDLPNDQPLDQQHIRDRVTSAARDFLATEARQKHSL